MWTEPREVHGTHVHKHMEYMYISTLAIVEIQIEKGNPDKLDRGLEYEALQYTIYMYIVYVNAILLKVYLTSTRNHLPG